MLPQHYFKTHLNQGLRFLGIVMFAIIPFTSWTFAYESAPNSSEPPTNPHASAPGPNTPMSSGVVGIAMHITAGRIGDPAQLIIRAVHPSGPASRAGVVHGEEIMTVDGEPVAGKTYMEVVGMIRGETGSSVKLGLQGPQGERTVSLMRISEERLMEQTPRSM